MRLVKQKLGACPEELKNERSSFGQRQELLRHDSLKPASDLERSNLDVSAVPRTFSVMCSQQCVMDQACMH
jgi:hypothetical protein